MLESEVLREIRLRLGREPDLVLFRNQAGFTSERGRGERYGLMRGASDLLGVLSPKGRVFFLEVKAPKKKPTREQIRFFELIRKFGGFADWADSVELALDCLERARAGWKCR